MSFLGRNINLALVALILILIVAATGVTLLYQRGLLQRTSQYENASTNLSQCLVQLENFKAELGKRETKINETSQDIRKYDTLYGQKVAELNAKQEDLQTTQGQLNAMTLQKEQFKALFEDARMNITIQASQMSDLQASITSLNTRLTSCQSSLRSCNARCP